MAPWLALRDSVRVLHQGGVIAYATESVWGLGCDPFNQAAVERIMAIKGRDREKGLIVIAADMDQILPLLGELSLAQRGLLGNTWPGPVTWLAPVTAAVPGWLKGKHPTLALRVSAHPGVQQLCRAFGGPLVSTSANRSGRPPAKTALQVKMRMGHAVDAILPGTVGGARKPTEIRDLATLRVIRAG